MLDLEFGQASDPGRVRTTNEDALDAFVPRSGHESRSRGWIFVLADGVGGMDLGEVASAKAVSVVVDEFRTSPEGASLTSLLTRIVQYANAAVHDEGLQPGRRGRHMATTVVACALRHDQAVIAHVGDSRCYLVRKGRASALTRDHTWVEEQRKLGLITTAEGEQSDRRHVLTRSLGPELFVTVDTQSVPVQRGDVLVLCSDGVHGGVSNEMLARIVSQEKEIDVVADELVRYAVTHDGSDNASAIVIRVLGVEAMGMYRGRPYPLPSA
jgi:protein phosphatase